MHELLSDRLGIESFPLYRMHTSNLSLSMFPDCVVLQLLHFSPFRTVLLQRRPLPQLLYYNFYLYVPTLTTTTIFATMSNFTFPHTPVVQYHHQLTTSDAHLQSGTTCPADTSLQPSPGTVFSKFTPSTSPHFISVSCTVNITPEPHFLNRISSNPPRPIP